MLGPMDAFDELLRETLNVAALLCFPVLIAATAVGTLVAIAQAATQACRADADDVAQARGRRFDGVFSAAAFDLCASLFRDAVLAMPHLVAR